jgi:hypothetical protein
MDILQEQANGMNMEYMKINTFEKRLIQWIEGFVDDTSIFANLELGNNIFRTIIRNPNRWSSLGKVLQTTGG